MGTDDFDDLLESYFWWLIDLVDDGSDYIYSHSLLLRRLFEAEFTFEHPWDDNRRLDGLDLRMQFAADNGIAGVEFGVPCSVLEMMVALACRCDHDIMGEPGTNTSYIWFRVMMDNAGWSDLTDDVVDHGSYMLENLFFNPENPETGFQNMDLGSILWPTKRRISGDIWAKMNVFLVENPEIG